MSAVLWLCVFACVLSSVQFSSVQLCSALCHPMDCSTSGLPVHHRLPELAQTHVMPSKYLSLCRPLSSRPQSSPASGSFQMSQFFTSGGQSIGVSALASVLPKNTQADLLLNRLVGSLCRPWDSQESSPTPQFKSMNSSALSFLYGPTLTSIHDYWKNHSSD